ncbi:uncharacterized protein [Nicotiana tomentosiformis]|uniref:uncharacterized protein n=1 Tax=Nicotiana tomentosiformis TaxID=4098 RepID=UPI00388C64B0
MDQIPGAPPVLKGQNSKKYTQLPYKPSATPELISKWFKMHDVPKYDGTSDPQEHITTYTTEVERNDLAPYEIESVLLKKFGETLMRGALTWYSLLPEHSIDSFEMLMNSFIKAHAGTKKVQARKADIFRIAQGESELLQDFVTRFQKERMFLPAVPDEWAAEEFTEGLNPRSLDASKKLKKGREKNKEKSKVNFDMDRRSLKGRFLPYERTEGRGRGFRSTDRFTTDRRTDLSRNNRSLQEKESVGTRDPSYPRISEYNFNVSTVELVSAMRNIKEARYPKPIRSDPSKRDPNLYCEYHGTNRHWIGDCRHLREEVATLLKNGHLREFLSDRAKNNYGRNRDNAEPSKVGEDPPCQMINMIFGGKYINGVTLLAAKKTKVSITYSKRLREVAEDDITFMEEDAHRLLLLHNDALVISLNVLDFKI